MAERLYGYGLSPVTEKQYKARIYDADFVGTSTPFDVVLGGISIKWETAKNSDRTSPILGSKASVLMTVAVGDTVIETFLEDLRTSKEGRFFLEITNDTDTLVVWRGVIIADNSWETDQGARFEASISAVDGLALLKGTPYYNTTGPALYTSSEALTKHLTKVLSKLTHQSMWAAGDTILETSLDWWAVGMTAGGANDPLHLCYVDNAAWYDYHTKGSIDDDVLSSYDVLVNILTTFGARILQIDGVYRVEQIDYRANSTYETRTYNKAGAFLTNSTRTGLNNITSGLPGAVKISYVTYDYIPQLKKARVSYEAKLRRNFWGNILLSQGTTFNFDQEISSNSGATTLRLRGNFMVSVKNNSYSGNPQDVLFSEMGLFLKIGSNYLKRDGTYQNFAFFPGAASWSTNSLNLVKIVSSGQQVLPVGLSQTFIFSFDFITPPLIGDGSDNAVSVNFSQLKRNNNEDVTESEFTITWTAGSMWMETYDLGTPDVQEDEVLYESINDDDGTDVWEAKTRLGSSTSNNYAGRLMNSSNVNWSLWGQGTATRDKAIGSLLADITMSGQTRAIKRMSGQLYGTFQPMRALNTSDGIRWIPMTLDWSLTEDLLNGTWFESEYNSTYSTETPIKKKYTPMLGGGGYPYVDPPQGNGFSGNGNTNFSNNSPGTVLAPISFNNLGAVITEAATITSIGLLVPSTGNDFLAGDGVTLCHPTSGKYQTFTIATAPTAGATSLSVTSVAAEFDAPIGSFLVVKQKPYSFSLPTATLGQILRYNGTAWVAFSGTNGEFLKWVTGSGWISAAASGGALADGDYGDITVSGTGTVMTIDGNVVTLAKFQQIATDSFLGRDTAGTGNIEVLSVATVKTLLNLTGTNSGDQTITLTGDVTGSGTGSFAATIAALAVSTAKIANSAVTYAKLQNATANNVLLGNNNGAGTAYEELSVAAVQTMLGFIDGTGSAGRIAYWTDANSLSNDADFLWDATNNRMTISNSVAGVGSGLAALNIQVGAQTGPQEMIRMSGNVNGNMFLLLTNASNLAGSNTAVQIIVGGSSAGDPFIQYTVTGVITTSVGIDNSDGDKFKISPNVSTPGFTLNNGICVTNDAVARVGINKDAPLHPLDVDGVARAVQFRNTGNLWSSSNIVFGTGAGTGPTISSISGGNNGFQINFTTGSTGMTANAIIFTATYPNAFGTLSYVVKDGLGTPGGANYNNEAAKFNIDSSGATTFVLKANGTLTAGTNYAITFIIMGY